MDSSKTFTSMSGSFSLHSLAEGSEIISEVDEIHEMRSLQHRGDDAFDAKQFQRAIQYYSDALDLDERNAEILGSRAAAYMEVGDGLLALRDAKRLSALKPTNPQAHFMQGIALECLQQYRDATTQFIRALENTNNIDFIEKIVHNVASTVSKFCKLPEKMVQQIKDMDPYVIISEIGACLFYEQKYDLCIRVLSAATRLQTKQAGITMKIQLTLANAHSALRHTELAISLYQECLQTALASHDQQYQAKSLVNIASLFLECGDTHQAIMYYEKLLALQHQLQGEDLSTPLPEYWNVDLQCALHLNLSIAYKGIGNVTQAVEHAHKYQNLVSTKNPNRRFAEAQSHKNVGMLNEILGQYEDALEHYKQFLSLSKRESDKRGIAQAQGCIGSIYAALCNAQLSMTFHEQHINNALKTNDAKMITLAYEQMGDSCMTLNNSFQAIEAFLNMLRSCLEETPELQATALCKIGTAYKESGERQLGLFYFEQAHTVAEDFGFHTVKVVSEYNIALLLQSSNVIYELDCAHKYFERLIHVFEAKIQQHRDEETFCSQELLDQLHQCYLGIQGVMIKLDEKEDGLVFAESFKKKYLCQLMVDNGLISSGLTGLLTNHMMAYDMWTFDRIKRVVTQQNATVVFYSLLKHQIVTWVLKPGEGLVYFYVKKLPTSDVTMIEHVQKLLQEIVSTVNVKDAKYRFENRSLSRSDHDLKTLQEKNKLLGKPLKVDKATQGDLDETICKKPPQRQLYDLLLGALENTFTDLTADSNIVFIPDQLLFLCPFTSLVNHEGIRFGDRFHVTVVSSLFALDRCHNNETGNLKMHDELQFDRQKAKHGGIAKLQAPASKMNMTVSKSLLNANSRMNVLNDIDTNKINPRKTSHPLLVKSGVFSVSKSSKMNNGLFSMSRESTMLSQGKSDIDINPKAIIQPPITMSHTKLRPPGLPTAVDKMAGVHTMSTLTTRTSTDTDVTSSVHTIPEFQQISAPDRCLVVGCPVLPEKAILHNKTWKCPSFMKAANSECLKVSDIFDMKPLICDAATKSAFLDTAPQATIIHIATMGCHDKGCLVFGPSRVPDAGQLNKEEDYLLTRGEICTLPLIAQLVVISGCWGTAAKTYLDVGHQTCSAFIAAGAQCVLTLLWPLPNPVLDKFYHHFYTSFNHGNHVTTAVQSAVSAIKNDERYSDPYFWSPFIIIGKDPMISFSDIRHSMLDQAIDEAERLYVRENCYDPLNPPSVLPNVDTKDQTFAKLQVIFATLLAKHRDNIDVVLKLVDLFDGALKKLHLSEPSSTTKLPRLSGEISNCSTAMQLLKLTGYHFQPGTRNHVEPYVIFPFSNDEEILLPCYDALRALLDVSGCGLVCVEALTDLVPIPQDHLSHIIDILCITRHAPEVQLKVTDISVKPMWKNNKIKSLLSALGFHQVGLLLSFKNFPENSKVLTGMLALLLSMSTHKSTILLHKLDVSLLGGNSDAKSSMSSDATRLPTLTPLILPRNQLRMSTPWLSTLEYADEMQEKLKLVRSKSNLTDDYRKSFHRAKTWHQTTVTAQAHDVTHELSRPRSTPGKKVKVVAGSSASKRRVPIGEEQPITLERIDNQRDYAHYVLGQRLDTLTTRHKNNLEKLYLPYVTN